MKATIQIEGMHCMHCADSVEGALRALGAQAKVDLENKCAYVQGEQLSEDALRDAVEGQGFDVTGIRME